MPGIYICEADHVTYRPVVRGGKLVTSDQEECDAMANPPVPRQQPESLRLRSIMPSFTVNDIDRSVQWYCEGLGFYLAERWEDGGKLKGVMLKAGACELGLTQDDFGRGRDRPKGAGFRIWCETTQDIDAIAKRLRDLGGTITEEPGNHWDSYSFTAQDPDGFKLTIIRAKG